MLPGMELMGCADLAVPPEVMQHVVRVESSFNPYAIGVVGGRLARQPRNLAEAVSTTRMLEREGYNFSLGIAQVNRHNLASQGLVSYEKAFEVCPNLQAGSRILAECYGRSGNDWGKAFSCYYSGNFTTGFRHGYVQKVVASWRQASGDAAAPAIAVVDRRSGSPSAPVSAVAASAPTLVARRIEEAALSSAIVASRVVTEVTQPVAAGAQPVEPGSQVLPSPSPSDAQASAFAASDAPVVVQAMGVVARNPSRERSASAQVQAPAEVRPAAPVPERDSAFVF